VDTIYYYPVIKDPDLRRFVFDVKDFTDSFVVVMPCDSSQRFTLTGVFLDNDSPGLTFHSIGVNGADLDDYLRCPYLEMDMELLQPDMVIFGIGINDANSDNFDSLTFKNRYLQLIQRIQKVNPECAFVFITNNDSYKKLSRRNYAVNKNNLQVREVFYRLSDITQGAVWDQFDIMGGLKSMDKWRQHGYAQTDRIHFTVKGYKLLGDLFFNAFVDAHDKALQ
jgi:lysophospholipase L1-like esterase